MKFKFNIFFIFVLFALIFSGCSKEDCSLKDTTYKKYSYDETSKTCVVSKTIKENVCGNTIVEDKETFCNCPKDVIKTHPTQGCTGTLGTYLEKSCSIEKTCVLKQNEKVVMQPKSVEFKNSDLTINTIFKLNLPYIQNSYDENKIELEVKLFKLNTQGVNIKNIEVKEISFEDANAIMLGNVVYNEKIDMTNNLLSKKIIGFSDVSKYEKKEAIKIKMIVTYDKEYLDSSGKVTKTELNKIETLIGSLGTWTIINPNLYDPKVNK